LIRLYKTRDDTKKLIKTQFILIFKDYISLFSLLIVFVSIYRLFEFIEECKKEEKIITDLKEIENEKIKKEDEIFNPYNDISFSIFKEILFDLPYFVLFILCLYRMIFIIFSYIKFKFETKNIEKKKDIKIENIKKLENEEIKIVNEKKVLSNFYLI
jgi:hypothetical protein